MKSTRLQFTSSAYRQFISIEIKHEMTMIITDDGDDDDDDGIFAVIVIN